MSCVAVVPIACPSSSYCASLPWLHFLDIRHDSCKAIAHFYYWNFQTAPDTSTQVLQRWPALDANNMEMRQERKNPVIFSAKP
jgi:hypothetical protein